MSTTTGENLVSISQITFEYFKINQNLSSTVDNQSYILDIQRYKMYNWLSTVNNKFWLILNFSKVVRDIDTKFIPVVNPYRNPLCTKFEGSRYLEFGFPAKNV